MTRRSRPRESGHKERGGRRSRRTRVDKSGEHRRQDSVHTPPPFHVPAPPRTPPLMTLGCVVAVLIATGLAFAPALHNEFVHWDDDTNLVKNTHIRSLSAESLKWMWTSSLLGVWQPLSWTITALEYRIFDGADQEKFSRGMHSVSIVLHGLAAVLVFFVARRLIALATPQAADRCVPGLNMGALFAALAFAVHPFRVETVAWASGQPYVLALVPALASVWSYLRAQETGRLCWHAAALGFLAASLLCKAMAVPLVAVYLVLDFYPLRRIGGAAGWNPRRVIRVILAKVPYAVLAIAVIVLTIWATWENKNYKSTPFTSKVTTASFCTMFYVCLTFVPYRLSPYYWAPTFFQDGEALRSGAALAFVVVLVVLVLLRRRLPWLLAVWSAYVLILLPNTGLVKHGGQITADRYSYLSCIGWAILVGALWLRIWGASPHRSRLIVRGAISVFSLALVVGLVSMTRAYCAEYRDSVAIWTAMVERNPRFNMGYYNLAKAHKRPCAELRRQAREADPEVAAGLRREAADRYRRAEENYRKAIALYPRYPDANVDLGNMIMAGHVPGGVEQAIEHYQTSLRGRPGFHMAHLNLGHAYIRLKRFDQAIEHLEAAEADALRVGQTGRLPSIRRALERARAKAATSRGTGR
ncbi:MAG: hypothetical protein GY842_20450 [bacterium]|nr:hypothetical protein [bacterium]